MPSERVQRQIDRLLDQVEQAIEHSDWDVVIQRAEAVLRLDTGNEDAQTYLEAARRDLNGDSSDERTRPGSIANSTPISRTTDNTPTSFANGRYEVKRFLGEGGKKKVYLAHDNLLDRDVAFALIKTEGLDDTSRERIKREAQAMGRLGSLHT